MDIISLKMRNSRSNQDTKENGLPGQGKTTRSFWAHIGYTESVPLEGTNPNEDKTFLMVIGVKVYSYQEKFEGTRYRRGNML